MQVKFAFGPNAGQVCHAPRDQFISILIQAGVLELVEAPQQTFNVQPEPNTPQFFVGTTNSATGALAVFRRVGAAVDYYSGPAEHITKTRGWESCPDNVVEQWRRTDQKQRAQVRG